jgi:hypothetical protein
MQDIQANRRKGIDPDNRHLQIGRFGGENERDRQSRPLIAILLAIGLFAGAMGSAATAEAQIEPSSLITKIGDEARLELQATPTGTFRTTQLESLTDSQLKLGDAAGAKKSIEALKGVLTQQGQIDSFQFDKAIELSVRLKDDASILGSIDGLPADTKIHALGTYGTLKAKDSKVAAVNDTIARIETILSALPPDPPIVQPTPPPLYPLAHVNTRHGADLSYWRIGVAAAENDDVPLAQKISANMTNDLLRIRVLAAIARRQHQDHAETQSGATLGDLKKLAESTTIDHDQAIATAVTAYAGCGDVKAALDLAPALALNDQRSTMTAAARQFLNDGDPSPVIQIATRYQIDAAFIPNAIDQIYRQGRIDEAKKAYDLALEATRQRADQPAPTVGQQIDRMPFVTTLIDGEIAIHDFTAATNHLRTLPPNATIRSPAAQKLSRRKSRPKTKPLSTKPCRRLFFFMKNFPQPLIDANLAPARALAKAGYLDAAKTVLQAANDRAEEWQGPLKIGALKLVRQAYEDIADAQAAAAIAAKLATIDAARPPAPTPPRQLSEADLEKAKRVKAAADILNEPNNGSREAQLAQIDRARKAVNDDGNALEIAIFAGALLNPNARITRDNKKGARDLLNKGQFEDAASVAETLLVRTAMESCNKLLPRKQNLAILKPPTQWSGASTIPKPTLALSLHCSKPQRSARK